MDNRHHSSGRWWHVSLTPDSRKSNLSIVRQVAVSNPRCYLRGLAASYGSLKQSNQQLAAINSTWSPETIYSKVGIATRCIAAPGETALDLGERAAEDVIRKTNCDPLSIDCLIFVSQSGDYVLPSSSCILQSRLGLKDSVAAFDVGLGCSGYNYALWLGRGLILARQVRRVLIVCAETYSRYCDKHDMGTVTLFGDGAAATILQDEDDHCLAFVGESILGTDGSGAQDLIVKGAGGRARANGENSPAESPFIAMDGPGVFRFALDRARAACHEVTSKSAIQWEDIDLIFCHQANRFMVQALQRQFGFDEDRMPIDVSDIGNLSTASLPVHIARWIESPSRKSVKHTVALGFGVGFSWGATHICWLQEKHCETIS